VVPADAALATIEGRVRTMVATRLRNLATWYTAALAQAARRLGPGVGGTELLSQPDVDTALTNILGGTETTTTSNIRAGHAAAAALGRTTALNALGADEAEGHPVAVSLLLGAVLSDVKRAFGHAKFDLAEAVRAAHDGISGDNPTELRVAAMSEAIDRAVRRLGVRVTAAAVVAVHRGFTDAHLAAYTAYAEAHPHFTLSKTWRATSADPCPSCAALHGVTLPLDQEFDHTATTDPHFTPPKVYRDLLGPPRHVRCRCRLDINLSGASEKLRQTVGKAAPATNTYLGASEIRLMPSASYRALVAFLSAALRTARRLARRIRRGG
jgi:hypothetical protein